MDNDRYVPLSELPFIKQIARQIYLDNIYNPYRYYNQPNNKQLTNRWLYEFMNRGNTYGK